MKFYHLNCLNWSAIVSAPDEAKARLLAHAHKGLTGLETDDYFNEKVLAVKEIGICDPAISRVWMREMK